MSDTFTGETYNTLCSDAEGYLAKGSPEQARELLQKAISLIGTRPGARSLLADTCMTMELWSEAREQLEILITLDEGNPNNHFRLAQVLEELGEYQLAADNYQVVLDSDPKHHGAGVAIRRITSRNRDTGINLADVFRSQSEETVEKADEEDSGAEEDQDVREGMQIYPDVPSEELFAEADDDEDDDSVDALLKNIGLSADSRSDDEEDDVSRLLENIGVSTSSTLAAAFGESDEEEGEADGSDLDETETPQKKRVVSLDEIFGTPGTSEPEEASADQVAEEEPVEASGAEVVEEVAEEEPEEASGAEVAEEEPAEASGAEVAEEEASGDEVAEEEPEVEEEERAGEAETPEEEETEDRSDYAAFGAGKTLEDIFKTAETGSADETPEEVTALEEASGVEVAEEEPEEASGDEVAEEEPEEASGDEVAEEEPEEASGDEVVEEEPLEEQPEEEAVEEEPAEAEEEEEPEVASGAGVVEEEPEEASGAGVVEEEPEETAAVLLKHNAEYLIDAWSSESGLLTVSMTSGTLDVEETLLSVLENSLETERTDGGRIRISGQGTFLLNCGAETPLRVDVRDNMIVRKDHIVLHTGEISLEPLDLPGNESLYVVKDTDQESVIFKADKPVRVILLGQNNRVFIVRTSSIMVTDPDIILSGSDEGFTEVSGSGKVYLIE